MTAAKNVADLLVLEATKQLDSLAQVVLLDQLVEASHTLTITTDDEVHVLKLSEDLGDDTNEKIDALTVGETGDEDDVDSVWVTRLGNVSLANAGVRSKSARVNGVRNGESFAGINLGAQNEVLFASVADADSGVKITEAPLDKLVEVNAEEIMEGEQRVLSEDSLQTERLGSHESNVLKDAGALMTVHNVDLFPN